MGGGGGNGGTACEDKTDVVGYRHCTSFGAWGRNMRFPRIFMEIGGNVRTYPTGLAAQTGTDWKRIVLKKWYTWYKDHIKLSDYEIHNGMSLELYYV
jgi:hypothetical protein